MLRFSCFNSHIHGQRTKKQAQPSFEAMVSDCDSRTDVKCSPIHFLDEHGSKIGEMNLEINCRISPMRQFRRSLSLGCNLQEEGRIFEENNSDEHTDVGFSCDGSRDQLHIVPTKLDRKSLAATTTDQDQEDVSVEPLNFSCAGVNNESIFSIGDQQYTEKEGLDKYNIQVDAEDVIDSGIHTPRSPSMISKSYSLPNLPSMLVRSGGCSPCSFSAYRNRSSDDLKVLGMMRNETCVHDTSAQHFPGHNEVFYLFKSGKNDGRNGVPDGYDDSYSYAASNKDWIVPEIEGEMYGVQNFRGESSSHQLDHLPNEDFKIRRIADWVIDLQECGPVEEIEVSRGPNDQGNKIPAAKEEANLKPSMHAAKKYISSLSASTNAAQLTNHGLVVIPFLSAFVSLKVVNLSGNSIVKITSGALPRGLHMLNLSKNKISTIEGLRELTRLRILDLSYNRVTRIGHGLASCSSLKELYLAGNKISEVEGLHRLLKLAVLDLRFNKISTSKGVGQLAANYNSLQAISLEGNPAQKNVGDEQLKKHLQGLLPHLAYYNRQSLKSSSFKDSSERSVRLGMAAHQFDRGHKPPPSTSTSTIRRASHSSTALKQHSSSLHNNKAQLADAQSQSQSQSQSQRRLRTKQGSRSTHHRHHHHHHHLPHPPLDLNMKPLVLPDLSIKKSHSMGALTAV